ncbi:hypothetical protein AAAC51_31095 [Priestia megaterium]
MKEVHHMPVLVAEFGIPASRGLTHRNVYGWDQGFHTEQEQGKILSRLYEDIVEEKWLAVWSLHGKMNGLSERGIRWSTTIRTEGHFGRICKRESSILDC